MPGLVAADLHPSPVPFSDVVTSTCHKTLRGPRGGLILCKEELAKKIDSAIFPRTQGGPLMHTIAAKAVCFYEAMQPEFIEYQKRVLELTSAMANELNDRGFKIVTNGTNNHLFLVDLTDKGITGMEAQERLEEIGVTVNKNGVPGDTKKPTETSGIRIGCAAIASKGYTVADVLNIASVISDCLIENFDKEILKHKIQSIISAEKTF